MQAPQQMKYERFKAPFLKSDQILGPVHLLGYELIMLSYCLCGFFIVYFLIQHNSFAM